MHGANAAHDHAERRRRAQLLLALFDAAVAAAHPDVCLPAHLPPVPERGRLIVVGAGKAAAAMAAAAERHYRERGAIDRIAGFTTAPHGTAEALPGERAQRRSASSRPATRRPDESSLRAAEETLALVRTATADDLVLVLLSGGASALWAAPAAGLDLAGKMALTRGLLKSGADIHEMNLVRRHVSRIKGGRLRKATPAPMLTLAISDVPGDDPATIGSGPTVADRHHARRGARRARPPSAAHAGSGPAGAARPWQPSLPIPPTRRPSPTIPPSPAPSTASSPRPRTLACSRGRSRPRRAGYEVVNLGDDVTGEAREVAQAHAKLALRGTRGGPQGRRS